MLFFCLKDTSLICFQFVILYLIVISEHVGLKKTNIFNILLNTKDKWMFTLIAIKVTLFAESKKAKKKEKEREKKTAVRR